MRSLRALCVVVGLVGCSSHHEDSANPNRDPANVGGSSAADGVDSPADVGVGSSADVGVGSGQQVGGGSASGNQGFSSCGSGVGGFGGSAGTSTQAGTGDGGRGVVCDPPANVGDYHCPVEVENGIACFPRRGRVKLERGDDAVFLLETGAGVVLRIATGAEAPSVVDTAGVAVQAMAVDEPYVYWASENGLGRTKTQADARGELLTAGCLSSSTGDLISNSGSLYWSWASAGNGRLLAFDTQQTNASAKHLLPSSSKPLGSDATKVYIGGSDYLGSVAKTSRCSCACGSAPGSALSCVTSSGVGPAAGAGGSPGYYEECGGQPTSIQYRSDGEQIQRARVDATHFYWSSSSTLSRLPKDSADLLDPLTENPGERTVILAPPSDARQLLSGGFALDGETIYAHRTLISLDYSSGRSEIVRLAKDGSELVSLYSRAQEQVEDLVVDDSSVFFVASDNCNSTLVRLPKQLAP